ncbi:MAG: hypothetical protein EZS28_011247 [Streblomastix strix]|uniref:Uncharacterized protein n=1 Tax=Streblomastix strix TaxID=222440 RepID=A0A5J4WE88_9EUKA|nr:MAG: hypothetical protein EZS28_011247 [Streblomastix strix]
MISADGNALTFNESDITGTGSTCSTNRGSVNNSQGNQTLYRVSSVYITGGFCNDGAKVYWRAKPVSLGSVPPLQLIRLYLYNLLFIASKLYQRLTNSEYYG